MEKKVSAFLVGGPRHGEKFLLDRAYPVFQVPDVQKYKFHQGIPEPLPTEHLTYERLMRSQKSGNWIYEFKEAA